MSHPIQPTRGATPGKLSDPRSTGAPPRPPLKDVLGLRGTKR